MKLGIITFHNAINYGAVLQTYALQTAIKKINNDCDVIDYRNEHIENAYKAFNIKSIKSVKDLISKTLYYPIKKAKNRKFRHFIDNNIILSKNVTRSELLDKKLQEYDRIIVGSDQVWNGKLTNEDSTFLLDFIEDNKKKYSYAASFGISNLDVDKVDNYRFLINQFKDISVREKQGADIIKSISGRDANVNIDPTLLLSKEEWYNICKKNIKSEKYILVYLMAESDSILKFAKELSEKTGYKILYLGSSLKKKIKAKYIRTAGIEDFIYLFKEASYIVTNSYHGLIFSINFNKNFFIELHSQKGNSNSRLNHIMDLFELRDREIIKGKNENIFSEIDYSMINRTLDKERLMSIEYLSKII